MSPPLPLPPPAVELTPHGRLGIRAIGRRKEAVAQIRLMSGGAGTITVNNRDYRVYFPVYALQQRVTSPLEAVGQTQSVNISARVAGGGIRGQADAMRLGIARALLALDETNRHTLRAAGHLTRDARVKERKKYGLKKARRAPQWQKR